MIFRNSVQRFYIASSRRELLIIIFPSTPPRSLHVATFEIGEMVVLSSGKSNPVCIYDNFRVVLPSPPTATASTTIPLSISSSLCCVHFNMFIDSHAVLELLENDFSYSAVAGISNVVLLSTKNSMPELLHCSTANYPSRTSIFDGPS